MSDEELLSKLYEKFELYKEFVDEMNMLVDELSDGRIDSVQVTIELNK